MAANPAPVLIDAPTTGEITEPAAFPAMKPALLIPISAIDDRAESDVFAAAYVSDPARVAAVTADAGIIIFINGDPVAASLLYTTISEDITLLYIGEKKNQN